MTTQGWPCTESAPVQGMLVVHCLAHLPHVLYTPSILHAWRLPFTAAQAIVQEHSNDARWGPHAAAILSGAMWQPPRPGGHDDKAHPPIHPTRHSAGEPDWSPGAWPGTRLLMLCASRTHAAKPSIYSWENAAAIIQLLI